MTSKPAAARRLGPYEFTGRLGAGGMGEVYRARDTRLGREVAIKVLPPEIASDADRLRRFEKEAQAASSLNHPNIVTIYEVERVDSTSFIVMELVEGKTLRDLVADGALPLRKLLSIAAQIADGLARAHSAGIVHRDLKPENVMMTKDGLVKILDFGLAKLAHPELASGQEAEAPTVSAGTKPGIVMGTVGYMSPEQASGHPVDFRSDQFSFGSLLYEMATGRGPFRRATAAQTLAAIIQDDPDPVALLNPKVPPPVRWIIERCLAKEPSERYASTADLAWDLENLPNRASEASESAVGGVARRSGDRFRHVVPVIAAAAALAVIGIGLLAVRKAHQSPPAPSFQRLTFRRGAIGQARFAPDGQTIVYDAEWEGHPPELFTTRLGASESRPLGLGAVNLRGVSSQGEMAIVLQPSTTGVSLGGTVARVPLAGGAPREVLENVQFADWAPDGKELAVVHEIGRRRRLEYPPGKVLYDVPISAKMTGPRFSPDGGQIAFIEGPDARMTDGSVSVIDLSGRKKALTGLVGGLFGLAWAPDGYEIWFFAPLRGGIGSGLYAVTLSGKKRLVHASSAALVLQDVFRDGRLLVNAFQGGGFGISALAPGESGERDLSWLDWSRAEDLSADGKTLLFVEDGAGGGPNGSIYTRKTDGSPAVRLGEGYGTGLSSDGKLVAAIAPDGSHLNLLPTGAGETRDVRYPGMQSILRARFFPDGRRLLLLAAEKNRGARVYVGDLEGRNIRSISPEGLKDSGGLAVSPDGELAAAMGTDDLPRLYPTSGVAPRSIPGVESGDIPLRFSTDGRRLFVARLEHTFATVSRIDFATGRREAWKELRANDPAGLSPSSAIQITPDGKSYAYTYRRFLNELLLVDGLK